MSKVLRIVGTIAAIAGAVALAIPTGGASIAAGGAALGGSLAGAAGLFGLTIGGTLAAVGLAASIGATLLAPKPKAAAASTADRDRLNATIDPRAPRTIVYGRTAMATDIRDQEFTGTDKEYFHRFLVVASHKVQAIEEIWFDDKMAWSVGGGVTSDFSGYLTVTPILEGNAGNAINISARMGTTRRYTGCAYVHLRYKLTGNSKKTDSPFAQSIPSRVTIRGKGMFTYDPRLDSTVAGGSGSHRADDQSTWTWSDSASRNPALQMLNYLLGWKINGILAVGKGIPKDRIDLASFITAANVCDESVSLAAGGTEPRYRTDGVFTEFDDMTLVLDQFKQSMNALLDDCDGLIRVTCLTNDLGSPVASFTQSDIISEVVWKPSTAIDDQINVIRGTYTDASNNSLYQSVSYPEISIASVDGIERAQNVDFPIVQSASQVQRLAKTRLQRAQYPGTISAEFQATAWRVQKNDVITLTFPLLGFTNKLFRVVETAVRVDGTVPMLLREENASIYAWSAEESAPVTPAAPSTYDYTKNPLYLDLKRAGNTFLQPTAPTGAESANGDKWIDANGTYYDRVGGGILLKSGGVDKIVTLGGYRPSIYWVRSAVQPMEELAANLTRILSDNWLSAGGEKSNFVKLVNDLTNNHTALNAKAAALSVALTERTNASNAITALTTYLSGLSPTWDDETQDTPVNGTYLKALFVDASNKVALLQAAVQGLPGNSTVKIYLRNYTPPSTPTGNTPSGWSTTGAPSGTATLWECSGIKDATGNLIGVWSAPVELAQGEARAFASGTTYYLHNLVTYNGGTYVALQNSFSGQAPSGDANATAYWGVSAAPGAAGTPATPPSGFTATINLTSSSGTNLRALANANGYPGGDATITFKVPSGVTVRGPAGGLAGIDGGIWPSVYSLALGIVIEGGGVVDGGGGNGGAGGGGDGSAGGDGIVLRCNFSGGVTINSGGTLRGGGGGGGGGSGTIDADPFAPIGSSSPYQGGGAGGGGRPNGLAGTGESGGDGGNNGGNGTAGTTGANGSGGTGGAGTFASGANGASGGNFATAGSNSSGTGGAAGAAVRKNGFTATVTNNGTMTGSVVS